MHNQRRENKPRAYLLIYTPSRSLIRNIVAFITSHCLAILPTNALRAIKKLKSLNFLYILYIYIHIILRAGTSIYASSGFFLWGQHPAGAKTSLSFIVLSVDYRFSI